MTKFILVLICCCPINTKQGQTYDHALYELKILPQATKLQFISSVTVTHIYYTNLSRKMPVFVLIILYYFSKRGVDILM